MNKISDHFQPFREWENFSHETITNISFEHGHYVLPKECIIKIWRDEQFNLKATISGLISDKRHLEAIEKETKGTFAEQENIFGYSNDLNYKVKIYGIVLGNYTSHPVSLEPVSMRFEAVLMLDRFEKYYYEPEKKHEVIQDWFLSSKVFIAFSRSTQRAVDKHYIKSRLQVDPEETSFIAKSRGSSRDYLLVNSGEFDFIVAKVPEEFGPTWSYNLCIEYRSSFKRLPTHEERNAIKELVSFVFGTQLLNVGTTYYGKSDQIISLDIKNPWGDNVVSKCSQGSLAPTDITSHNKNQAELLINSLLPLYLKNRDSLRLSGAIWKYWIARYSSIGTNLPILASAIETLAEFILKEHNEVKPYYIAFDEFQKLIEVELNTLSEKLKDNLNAVKILNKIKGASQRGSNERVEMMFEVIKLNVGKVERRAMKERNKMAHSSFGKIDNEEAIKLIRLTRAYETLFHRVFLKILGYTGEYIDYYTSSHPKRLIDDFIPEES